MVLRLRGGPSVGLAVGGGKDIESFRNSIKERQIPHIDSITAEGLFNEYFFDTGDSESSTNKDKLFFPTFSFASSPNPVSGEPEHWMTVGLNSSITEFDRKELNLVILLDISGSMNSSFDNGKSKLMNACETIINIINRLDKKDKDQFGIILFDDKAVTFHKFGLVPQGKEMEKLKNSILQIQTRGGTYMECGYKAATEMISSPAKGTSPNITENRILVLTDDMPNIGETGTKGWCKLLESNASEGIYTTFIGVGVDFNPELIQSIAKVKGTNYYSTNNSAEFKKRLETDFKYLVTPLVFNMQLSMKFPGFEVEKVYGNPDSDVNGALVKVGTFFASPLDENGRTKGGIILLKLKQNGKEVPKEVHFSVAYEERDGKKVAFTELAPVPAQFLDEKSELYENSGIRKAVALARFTQLMKDWIGSKKGSKEGVEQAPTFKASGEEQKTFSKFYQHLEAEIKKIGDNKLEQELHMLDAISK